jgi:hypothetical protein
MRIALVPTLTVAFLVLVNAYWRHVQLTRTLLANYGFLAQLRYMVESVGPELRQYLFASEHRGAPVQPRRPRPGPPQGQRGTRATYIDLAGNQSQAR